MFHYILKIHNFLLYPTNLKSLTIAYLWSTNYFTFHLVIHPCFRTFFLFLKVKLTYFSTCCFLSLEISSWLCPSCHAGFSSNYTTYLFIYTSYPFIALSYFIPYRVLSLCEATWIDFIGFMHQNTGFTWIPQMLRPWMLYHCCLASVKWIPIAFLFNHFFFRLILPLLSSLHGPCRVGCLFSVSWSQTIYFSQGSMLLKSRAGLHLPLIVPHAFSTILCT